VIVYRHTDRIPVKMGEIKFWISPLKHEHRVHLSQFIKKVSGEDVVDTSGMGLYVLKCAIKEVEGVSIHDGSAYELEFDANGILTDDCLEEVLRMTNTMTLLQVVGKLIQEVKDYQIEGVEIDLKGVKSVSKKK
jgi:hypothetical protein